MQPRILEVRTQILKKNDTLARSMREEFLERGTYVINLVSSPGTGKTAWLQKTLQRMVEGNLSVAALVGDLETDNDAKRLAASGAPVRQIMTHGCCHLEAEMIRDHLADWKLGVVDYLFIENVGNLVCPSSWDLGESLRVAMLSVSEGEDKPLKYPGLFNSSDVAVITKTDLAEACEFRRQLAYDNLRSIQPKLEIFEGSAKTGEGLEAWIAYLMKTREELLASRGVGSQVAP